MIFDTHSHCHFVDLEDKIEAIVENMQQAKVSHAIQIGCDLETTQAAVALTRRFPSIFYATVGHHPGNAQDDDFSIEKIEPYEQYIIDNRDIIVAIGETGFDYHYLTPGKEIEQKENQRKWWKAQWELAKKYKLPLIIHTRDAREDTLKFIIENNIDHAVIHCYSEDPDFAKILLNFATGIYFAFGGILTYKKSESIQETAKMLPLDRILLETDAPYLAPQVVRGTVNEPANTGYILDRLCELRTESREEVEKIVYENSLKFYGIEA